jgi:hypothetical protein
MCFILGRRMVTQSTNLSVDKIATEIFLVKPVHKILVKSQFKKKMARLNE